MDDERETATATGRVTQVYRRADALLALGLTDAASDDEVRSAFRLRVKNAHPDVKGGTDALLRRLILARDLLIADGKKDAEPLENLHYIAGGLIEKDGAILLTITVDQAVNGGEAFQEVPALEVTTPQEELSSLTEMKTLRVTLPAGLREGDKVKLKTEGTARREHLFRINIKAEDDRRATGDDIWMTAAIEARVFFNGGDAVVETPHGPQEIHIGRAFPRGSSLCIKEKGLPATDRYPAGDLYVRLEACANAVRPHSQVIDQFRQRWAQ